MTKTQLNKIWKRRLYLCSGAIVLVLAGWFVYQRVLSKPSADDLRRQEIEKMAVEIKTKFPDIIDMDARHAIEQMKDKKLIRNTCSRKLEVSNQLLDLGFTRFWISDSKAKDFWHGAWR